MVTNHLLNGMILQVVNLPTLKKGLIKGLSTIESIIDMKFL